MTEIVYPYLPEGRVIDYVATTDKFIGLAKAFARAQSLDKQMPCATVIVKDGLVIGIGANGSIHHEVHGCDRVRRGCKSGEGYDLCEGCNPVSHSEAKAIRNALNLDAGSKYNLRDARLYLWGHWYCCKDCWDKMIDVQIGEVCLMHGSQVLFNKEVEGNIVGRQFEAAK